MRLTIIMPVFNEGGNIESAIEKLETDVSIPHQTLLIYDFEGDNTLPPAKKLIKKYPHLKLVKNKYGEGVLKAIKTGFEAVKNGAMVVMMADLADDPATVNEMYRQLNQGADIVCGSRYSKGGRIIGGPWLKKTLSRLAGVSLHYLIGIPTFDVTNAFKMYRREMLDKINIESQGGFELSMEITLKAFFKGFKITEVPTIWRDRTAGQSNFKLWSWLPRYFHWYFWAIKQKWIG